MDALQKKEIILITFKKNKNQNIKLIITKDKCFKSINLTAIGGETKENIKQKITINQPITGKYLK